MEATLHISFGDPDRKREHLLNINFEDWVLDASQNDCAREQHCILSY